MLLSNCISSSIDLYLYFICICIYLCICISLSKTYDGELLYGERGEEKFAPVSPHQLINHFANVFVKSHACGFQTDLPLIFVSSILPSLFFHIPVRLSHLRAVPSAQMIINHCKIGNFRKILARAEISISPVSRYDLSQKSKR